MISYTARLIILICIPLFLTACGGGGGGGSSSAASTPVSGTTQPDPVTPPTVNPPNDPAPAVSKSLTLSWTAPTSRANGDPLLLSELAGYEIYYFLDGSTDEQIIPVNDPATTSYTTAPLPAGTYYFAISAVDTSGVYSELSEPVEVIISGS